MSIHKGEFNFKLKKTGFLSQPKMEAHLIARHPQRFLEHYADRKIGILNSENDALENFIEEVKEAGDYNRKEENLMQKEAERKHRAFLLHMASSPAINSDLMKDFNTLLGDQGQNGQVSVDYEAIIENFLTEIKMADKEDIEDWIASHQDIRQIKLPYGLPENLRMPLDPSNQEDEIIINFIECASDEFLLLDGAYHTKMEEVCKKMQENYIMLTENSKWTIAESALLFYVVTALDDSPTPASSALQYEMTRRLFPTKYRDEIISQKYLLKSKRVMEEKRGNVIRDWLRDKQDLQAKTNAAWAALHRERVKKLEHSIRLKKQRQVCLEWAQLLKRMREVKSENIQKIQVMAEPFVQRIQALDKQKNLKEQERQQLAKSAAQKYKEKKMQQQNMDREKKEEIEKIIEKIRKTQLDIQKRRVDFRKDQLEQKIRTKMTVEMMAEEERQRKAAILESTKKKIEIEYDPANLMADTHATMVRRHETLSSKRQNDAEDVVKFFREQYSFSAETLWRDRRVKLEAKLREVGLINTSYAQAVLKAMQPSVKPHLVTQLTFESDP